MPINCEVKLLGWFNYIDMYTPNKKEKKELLVDLQLCKRLEI